MVASSAKCMSPTIIPGGKPVNAHTFVPILPVTSETPALLIAPAAENNAYVDKVPRSGACAKVTIGDVKINVAINACCILFNIFFKFN